MGNLRDLDFLELFLTWNSNPDVIQADEAAFKSYSLV